MFIDGEKDFNDKMEEMTNDYKVKIIMTLDNTDKCTFPQCKDTVKYRVFIEQDGGFSITNVCKIHAKK